MPKPAQAAKGEKACLGVAIDKEKRYSNAEEKSLLWPFFINIQCKAASPASWPSPKQLGWIVPLSIRKISLPPLYNAVQNNCTLKQSTKDLQHRESSQLWCAKDFEPCFRTQPKVSLLFFKEYHMKHMIITKRCWWKKACNQKQVHCTWSLLTVSHVSFVPWQAQDL